MQLLGQFQFLGADFLILDTRHLILLLFSLPVLKFQSLPWFFCNSDLLPLPPAKLGYNFFGDDNSVAMFTEFG